MLFHRVHDPFLLSPHAHTLHFSLSLHDSSISHRSHPPCFILLSNNLAQISILGSSIAHSSFLEFVRGDYFAGIEPYDIGLIEQLHFERDILKISGKWNVPWERRENSRRVDQRISPSLPFDVSFQTLLIIRLCTGNRRAGVNTLTARPDARTDASRFDRDMRFAWSNCANFCEFNRGEGLIR